MPFGMFGFDLVEEYPRTSLIVIVLTMALGTWAGVTASIENQASSTKFNAYMAGCIEHHTEQQCLAYLRYNRSDLGARP